jgi:DNA-binding NarL/FixJ family response regulator
MDKMIRILVTASHDEDRAYIIAALSSQDDFSIAGIEKDEVGAIIKTERLKPDVLILDLQMPGISADELAPIIHRRSPLTAIIMLCNRDEDYYAGLALKSGISGFLLKDVDTDKLVPIVKIVSSGEYFISASIIIRVFNTVTFNKQLPEQARQRHCPLFSPTERGIITDIARGFSDEEIARHLNYSIGSIRNCLTALKRKIKLKNRMQIVIFSLFHGLINIDQLGSWLTNPWENKPDAEKEKSCPKNSDRQFYDNTIQ